MNAQYIGTFDVGDEVEFTAEFADEEGGPLDDPDAVVWKVREPDGTETTYTVADVGVFIHTETGVFKLKPGALNEAGRWYVRAKGTAGILAAVEGYVDVSTSAFVNP